MAPGLWASQHLGEPGGRWGGVGRGGQAGARAASCTCGLIEEGARLAVDALEAAGVDAHALLALSLLAAFGAHGPGDLDGGEKEMLSLLFHTLEPLCSPL